MHYVKLIEQIVFAPAESLGLNAHESQILCASTLLMKNRIILTAKRARTKRLAVQ